ncbi:hypothetical protein SMX93_004286 [Cronobacter turicensis]|nr:hypothetical protein [Cronobacter turicensis]
MELSTLYQTFLYRSSEPPHCYPDNDRIRPHCFAQTMCYQTDPKEQPFGKPLQHQAVAVPHKGRHAKRVLLPAASAEGVITIGGALLCAVTHRKGFRELMLRVPPEPLRGVPGDMFGGDIAEIILTPAFVLIHAQAVVVQRRRGEGYIYFIYTNKLFAIIVCDHIHIIFCIFNFILENIVKPTKLRIYNCNILQVTLAPRFQIVDNIFHSGAINQRFSFVKLNILWKILRHKIHHFISHPLMQPNKILN